MITCNKLVVEMGNVSWRGGSREIIRPTATTQLKMEGACNLCNVIEIFCWRKITKTGRGGPFGLSNSKWHWYNCVKTHSPAYVNIQIPPLLRGGIDRQGVGRNNSIFWIEPHQKQQILGWYMDLWKYGQISF